jgi:transcriptional regulator with XRE-family HTH domain
VAEEEPSSFGEYIRRQRELQELSMRQLADLVGISNPYLSQIERGLREPSERVLEAIADNLEMSAETLKRHRARRSRQGDGDEPAVVAAIRADTDLTAGQRKALIDVYEAFTRAGGGRRAEDSLSRDAPEGGVAAQGWEGLSG